MVEGKILITALYDLISSEENGLKINDVIEKIDGQNVNDIIKQRGRYLNGSNLVTKLRQSDLLLFSGQNDSVRLTINRNGNSIEKVVKRYTSENMQYAAKPKLTWEIKPNNIGYINMGLLTIKETRDVMNQLKQTKSIIFDLRNYPKGTFMVLPTYLFSEPRSFAKLIAPDPDYPGKFYWKKEFPKGSKNNDAYNGKLIVLVNEQTQSQAEWTAMVIQSVPGTVTIGSQTAGADGDVSTLEFPNGSKIYMTGLGVFYPDGTETQRKGIKIDIEIKPTILGIQQGKDEVLEKALEIAKQ